MPGANGVQRGRVLPFHALLLALTAPPLAALLLLVLSGASPMSPALVLSTLAPAYALGGAPAFLAGWLDRTLARRGWRTAGRLCVMAGIACAIGVLLLAPLYLTGRVRGAWPLLVPLALSLSALLALGLAMVVERLRTRLHRR